MLVQSGLFQKAGRERGCSHTWVWKNPAKPSKAVQNRSSIRVVRKSEPEIGQVYKPTVPFPYEQKRQVQFRSTVQNCWVSTSTRKCISLTELVTLSQTLFVPVFLFLFLFLETSFLNLISVSPKTLFYFILLPMFFRISLTINFLSFGDGQ